MRPALDITVTSPNGFKEKHKQLCHNHSSHTHRVGKAPSHSKRTTEHVAHPLERLFKGLQLSTKEPCSASPFQLRFPKPNQPFAKSKHNPANFMANMRKPPMRK